MNPVIRQESPSDAAAIHAVTAAAFLNAPHTAHTEQFIVEALRKAGALPRFGFKPEPSLVLPCVRSEYFQALLFGSSLQQTPGRAPPNENVETAERPQILGI